MADYWKVAARRAGGPIVGLIVDGMEASSKLMDDASNKNLESLKEEASKQQIKMDYSQHQARVAQELAIAKRIENATEVEIEEYYDNSGKGTAGLTINAEVQTGSLGVSGENRRVSKRVYRFKGIANDAEETYEQEHINHSES